MEKREQQIKAFGRLLDIMDDLRTQCPWDQKQTWHTLKNMTIEETYELAEAITAKDVDGLREELGDLLLHIVFYAKIGEEKNVFDIGDVIEQQCQKMIHRHPHIYGKVKVENEEDVKRNWEQIKLKEGKKSVLQGVPDALPGMIKAWRMQEKAKQVGFEWDHREDVWAKVEEELDEFREAESQEAGQEKLEDEFGDILFALINYARFLRIDPEAALQKTNRKFKRRFEFIESQAATMNKSMKDLSLTEMDAIWNQAKRNE